MKLKNRTHQSLTIRVFVLAAASVLLFALFGATFAHKSYAAQTASFSLSPITKVTNVGSNLVVTLSVNTGGNDVTAFQASLRFSTIYFSFVSIADTVGSPFTVDPGSGAAGGTITISRGVSIIDEVTTPFNGTAAVVKVTLKATKVGVSPIKFNPICPDTTNTDGCSVIASGSENVLNAFNEGSYTNVASTLLRGHTLTRGKYLRSLNTHYKLALQTDGNLVLRNGSGKDIWDTKTHNKGGYKLSLRTDGNLVLYTSSGKAIWSTHTAGKGGYRLAVHSNGNLVLYTSSGKAIWDN